MNKLSYRPKQGLRCSASRSATACCRLLNGVARLPKKAAST
jgi:hypothetical protein